MSRAAAFAEPPRDRFVYCSANLLVDAEAARVEALLDRAAKTGYTGLVLADSKFCQLGDMPASYFEHARHLRESAVAKCIEIVPCVFPIGYSSDLLSRDQNLAEAMTVRDAVFIVHSGSATLRAEPPVALAGGDMNDPNAWAWHDSNMAFEDGIVVVRNPRGSNARIVSKPITLEQHRQYHVWAKVRTHDFAGTPEIKVLAPRGEGVAAASLSFSSLGAHRTQDWTTHHVVFNSLDFTSVSIYFGCWDGSTGELAWDEAGIEEVGLLNIVRRDSEPLTVEVEEPAKTQPPSRANAASKPAANREMLREGVDFKAVIDPKMGTVPWPGGYEVYHEPPGIELLHPLADGTRLRVSYSHAITVNDEQVMICPSEPKTYELLADQADRVHSLWNAKAYWMSHDEIRCMNQDHACLSRGLSPGQILAENVKQCAAILHKVNPGGRIYAWSDMFDPAHNAHSGYYLVNGDLAGSWEGLDTDVIIACWYFDKRAASMKFFADRGHPLLIAGYYDGPPGAGVTQIGEWLSGVPSGADLRGVMYTTWERRYEDMESFAAKAWGQ